tara:strand:- start:1699 stop:2004 length:306 start_codon:yes stop_codon:yes gene_type:complete
MLEDGTYDKDGLPVKYYEGYQVGLWDQPLKTIIRNEWTLELLISRMTKTTEYFGAWTDSNGDLYLEPCIWIKDRVTAETVGRALNQIAIWDWTNMEEIQLN